MRKVIKCCQCGKELPGGFYNTPQGTFCPECWEKKPKKIKEQALSEVLSGLSCLGKMIK